MSVADTRRDTGDFYPGGKRVVTTPVAMGGDVKHSDFADVTVETNSIPKMRLALETLAQKLGATVAAIAIAVASIGAGFDSVPVNDIDFDANPSVVTNVTFDGLLQAETDPSWAARSNAVMQAVWSLGSLACLDALGWSDITNKPSWIGSSKPSYSLNEICPDTENWLGVQGNAGRHIKVLAGTVGGQIVGGLRVTASAQNDNNMTTYTYGGVAVRRNGVNTDYVFDESSDNGIVRRAELASLAPATNIARSALAQDVQASLDKADSALQTAPVTSVNGKTGAVSLTASDVGAVPKTGGEMTGQLRINQNLNILPPVPIRETGLLVRFVLPYGDIVSAVYGARDITLFNGDNAPVAVLSLPTTSGTLALTSDIPSVAGLAPLASPAFTGTPTAPTPTAGDDSTKVATTAFVQEAISGISSWSATNTVAVIARHTGKETVSIPSGGNLVADLSGWNDGVQTFVVLQPSGAYTVASNIEYCGYGTWPTNTALCVAWPYDGTLYVNPITIIRE